LAKFFRGYFFGACPVQKLTAKTDRQQPKVNQYSGQLVSNTHAERISCPAVSS